LRLLLALALCLSLPARADEDDGDDDRATTALADGERVERVPTRKGVEVPVLIVEPHGKPSAIVLLYPGGGGRLGLSAKGLAQGADNFMVRTRRRFADAGLVAVVVDAPSDRTESLADFRIGAESAQDSAALAAWAAAKWAAPVWLIGTSRGTMSVGNAAARGVAVRGIVLTSSVTVDRKGRPSLAEVPVDKITVPVLLVHHAHDACPASPLEGMRKLRAVLGARTVPVAVGTFDGGAKPTGSKCSPLSHHGFLGLDADVVDQIVAYLSVT
jgi:hypothetical protein